MICASQILIFVDPSWIVECVHYYEATGHRLIVNDSSKDGDTGGRLQDTGDGMFGTHY